MKVGLIGYQGAGRSTLYRAAAQGMAKGDVTAAPVPDPRFDAIVKQVKPKKATPVTILLHDDLEDASPSGRTFSPKFIESAKKMDLLLHVVRAFDNPMAAYFDDVDPLRDEANVNVEIVLADLQTVENRLEKLAKAAGAKVSGSAEYLEKEALERFKGPLEDGIPIRKLDLTEDEEAVCRNFQFLSAKPMIVAFNVDEGKLSNPGEGILKRIAELEEKATPAFVVSAPIEEEIALLPAEDQGEFLESLGVTESAGAKVIRAVYGAMNLITFFTAGENDTHAWPLRRGAKALKAAATIHNDIAKGFIRAEIVHFEDYLAAGSLDAAYSAGKMSLEGKEYVIQDGDLLHIRNKS